MININNSNKKIPLNVLISSYACEPKRGSEPGVGWEWSLEIANKGHNVVVMTRANNKKVIDNFFLINKNNIKGIIRFEYFDLPHWVLFIKKIFSCHRIYYILWQIFVFKKIKKITKKENFDLVHHITFVSLRHFSYLGNLGIPFILGPLAGGDSSPKWLRKSIGWKFLITEYFRDFMKKTLIYDPFFNQSLKKANLIICSTPATKKVLPKQFKSKSKIINQVSMNYPEKKDFIGKRNHKKVLYVGRFTSLKGMDIGIESFALALQKDKDLSLTIVGKGAMEKRWKLKANKLGVSDKINWVNWLKQSELNKIYLEHSIFLFPSLHDSGGKVMFEAISKGLRVIALKIGGPEILLNNKVGRVIDIKNSNRKKLLNQISQSINYFGNQIYDNQLSYNRAIEHYKKWNISKLIDDIGIY